MGHAIKDIDALEILASRAYPTLRVLLKLNQIGTTLGDTQSN
jgi:hypothetical protein